MSKKSKIKRKNTTAKRTSVPLKAKPPSNVRQKSFSFLLAAKAALTVPENEKPASIKDLCKTLGGCASSQQKQSAAQTLTSVITRTLLQKLKPDVPLLLGLVVQLMTDPCTDKRHSTVSWLMLLLTKLKEDESLIQQHGQGLVQHLAQALTGSQQQTTDEQIKQNLARDLLHFLLTSAPALLLPNTELLLSSLVRSAAKTIIELDAYIEQKRIDSLKPKLRKNLKKQQQHQQQQQQQQQKPQAKIEGSEQQGYANNLSAAEIKHQIQTVVNIYSLIIDLLHQVNKSHCQQRDAGDTGSSTIFSTWSEFFTLGYHSKKTAILETCYLVHSKLFGTIRQLAFICEEHFLSKVSRDCIDSFLQLSNVIIPLAESSSSSQYEGARHLKMHVLAPIFLSEKTTYYNQGPDVAVAAVDVLYRLGFGLEFLFDKMKELMSNAELVGDRELEMMVAMILDTLRAATTEEELGFIHHKLRKCNDNEIVAQTMEILTKKWQAIINIIQNQEMNSSILSKFELFSCILCQKNKFPFDINENITPRRNIVCNSTDQPESERLICICRIKNMPSIVTQHDLKRNNVEIFTCQAIQQRLEMRESLENVVDKASDCIMFLVEDLFECLFDCYTREPQQCSVKKMLLFIFIEIQDIQVIAHSVTGLRWLVQLLKEAELCDSASMHPGVLPAILHLVDDNNKQLLDIRRETSRCQAIADNVAETTYLSREEKLRLRYYLLSK